MGDPRSNASEKKEGGKKMKKSTITLILALALTVSFGAILTIDDAYSADPADPAADYRIWGSSTADKGSIILAIDEEARIIFPIVKWSIYLTDSTHVMLTTPNGIIVDDILAAGIHDFSDTYESGSLSVNWSVGDDKITYALTVASGGASALDIDDPPATITMEKWIYERENQHLAIGCILCALVPSLFLIPYFKRKKDDEYYLAF